MNTPVTQAAERIAQLNNGALVDWRINIICILNEEFGGLNSQPKLIEACEKALRYVETSKTAWDGANYHKSAELEVLLRSALAATEKEVKAVADQGK